MGSREVWTSDGGHALIRSWSRQKVCHGACQAAQSDGHDLESKADEDKNVIFAQ